MCLWYFICYVCALYASIPTYSIYWLCNTIYMCMFVTHPALVVTKVGYSPPCRSVVVRSGEIWPLHQSVDFDCTHAPQSNWSSRNSTQGYVHVHNYIVWSITVSIYLFGEKWTLNGEKTTKHALLRTCTCMYVISVHVATHCKHMFIYVLALY